MTERVSAVFVQRRMQPMPKCLRAFRSIRHLNNEEMTRCVIAILFAFLLARDIISVLTVVAC